MICVAALASPHTFKLRPSSNGKRQREGLNEDLYDQKGAYFRIFSAMANALNIEKIAEMLD